MGNIEEPIQVASRLILHRECYTVGSTEAGNHRWLKGYDLRIFDGGSLFVNHTQYSRARLRVDEETLDTVSFPQTCKVMEESTGAFFERFQLDNESSLVGTLSCNEVVTHDLLTGLNSRIACQHLIYDIRNFLSTCLTGGGRCRYGDEQRACILVGHKACLGCLHCYHEHYDAYKDNNSRKNAAINGFLYTVLIFSDCLIEYDIEACMEPADECRLMFTLFICMGF